MEAELESAPAEPIVSSRESLSKYRKGGEAEPALVPATPAPSTEFTIRGAWDGGATLPGESLSRHRRTPPPTEQGSSRAPLMARAIVAAATPPLVHVVEEDGGLEVAVTAELQPEVAQAGHPEQVAPEEILHEVVALEPTAAVREEPKTMVSEGLEAEYEPAEGSASFRVDPAAPREFRQSAPVAELPASVAELPASVAELPASPVEVQVFAPVPTPATEESRQIAVAPVLEELVASYTSLTLPFRESRWPLQKLSR